MAYRKPSLANLLLSSNENKNTVPKFEAFAHHKLDVAQRLIYAFDKIENIARKGDIAGNQHFFPFPTIFSKAIPFCVVSTLDYVVLTYREMTFCAV